VIRPIPKPPGPSSNGAGAFQADGRFVVAGTSGPRSDVEIKAARFNIDGAVDGTFFNAPFNFGTPAGQTHSTVQGIGSQYNAQLVLGGAFSTNGQSVFGNRAAELGWQSRFGVWHWRRR
jgi:hypothetical protein